MIYTCVRPKMCCMCVVDTTDAGMGDVDVDVTDGAVSIPVRRQALSTHRTRYTFVPRSPRDHLINIHFNSEAIPGELYLRM